MPSIPSVVALAPIVMVPGENFPASADVRGMIPNSTAGAELESVVSVESITVTPADVLDVDAAGEASFDSSTINVWIDAAAAVHGQSFTIIITFKARPSGGNVDGSDDRTRKAICPVLIRERDINL